jgi:hypothetical protein
MQQVWRKNANKLPSREEKSRGDAIRRVQEILPTSKEVKNDAKRTNTRKREPTETSGSALPFVSNAETLDSALSFVSPMGR